MLFAKKRQGKKRAMHRDAWPYSAGRPGSRKTIAPLRAKQKAARLWCIGEQFRRYFSVAINKRGLNG